MHSAEMGSANHTIMLQRDYFELLTVLAPTERNQVWQQRIAAGGGIGGVVLTTEDPAAALDFWQSAGFTANGPHPFSRPVVRADGTRTEARFETVTLQGDPGVGQLVFACSQPTRDAVWLPELMTHANTATGLAQVTLAAADPERVAGAWARILPQVATTVEGADIVLTTASHRIVIGPDPAATTPRAIGLDIRDADLTRCRAALVHGGLPFNESDGRLTVEPGSACHVRLGFVG